MSKFVAISKNVLKLQVYLHKDQVRDPPKGCEIF